MVLLTLLSCLETQQGMSDDLYDGAIDRTGM